MTYEIFNQSLSQASPPTGLNAILTALWYDGKGDWEKAHEIAQSREGVVDYDRLHAYLHRKEGDSFNAGYWYRRAKVPVFGDSLAEEWRQLVEQQL